MEDLQFYHKTRRQERTVMVCWDWEAGVALQSGLGGMGGLVPP